MASLENIRLEDLLPEQLRGTAENLINFLDNYYTQENVDNAPSNLISLINQNQDLDRVADEKFAEALAQTIAKNVPSSLVTERTFLLKRLVDYYNLKGTSKSIIVFFQLFYNKIVQIEEPYQRVIVPSGANFNKNEFVRIVLDSPGRDVQNLKGKLINSKNSFGLITGRGIIDRVSKEEYEEDIYTLHFDTGTVSGTFFPQDTLNLGEVEYGTLYRTLSEITIKKGGLGFKVGDEYYLDGIGKSTFTARVKATGIQGEVLKFDIIQRGSGNTIKNKNKLIDFKYGGTGPYVPRIRRGVEIQKPLEYESPARQLETEFHFSTLITSAGYNQDEKSQLSSNSVVQDGNFYDRFTYEIKSNINFKKYKDLFTSLIHPAGYNVFNDIKLETRPPLEFKERGSKLEIFSLESVAFQPGGPYEFGDSPGPGSRLGDSPMISRPDIKLKVTAPDSLFRDNYSFVQSPPSLSTWGKITNSSPIMAGGVDYFMEDYIASSPALRAITISGLVNDNFNASTRNFYDDALNGKYLPGINLSPRRLDCPGFRASANSPLKEPRYGKINGKPYWAKDMSPETASCPKSAIIWYSSPRWLLQVMKTSRDNAFYPIAFMTDDTPELQNTDLPPTKGWVNGNQSGAPASKPILTYNEIVSDSFSSNYL